MSQNKRPSSRAQYREVAESDTDSPMPSRKGSADHQVVDFGDDTNTLIGHKNTLDDEKYSFNHTTYPPPPPQLGTMDYMAQAAGTSSGPSTSAGTPTPGGSGSGTPKRPKSHRWQSADLLSGLKHFEHAFEEFDTRKASATHLAFAQGDMPNTKFAKLYNYLLSVSIITRWILFIVPVMAILWIPGILSFTKFPNAMIWNVKLIWWSIWLTVVWGGWWGCVAVARIIPGVLSRTIGLVAIGTRKYIDWMDVLHRYVALWAWTLTIWITWQPLISTRMINTSEHPASANTADILKLINKLLFSLFLCASLLGFEKFSIQWIAGKFHERSYAERIAAQKLAVHTLVVLYRNSSDLGRHDTLSGDPSHHGMSTKNFLKKALKGVRGVATTTTTALGNVASEIAGSSVLQPNSPQAMVKTALQSANKTRLLARRLYYSFIKPGQRFLTQENFLPYFPTPADAELAFALFDKDSNGDVNRDEMEMACLEFHREQLSIEHSMRDLDSAVGRLDNIFMTLYVFIALLIIAVSLDASLSTLITGWGTAVLGLSWLIGSSCQEILLSIIFLFIKHPYDTGDRIVIGKETYTVKEINLLSTVMLDSNQTTVQAPNSQLNTQFILNMRRSPQMSESITFNVAYSTTFEQLEALRQEMIAFLEKERRDYVPTFDVTVVDFPDQASMALSASINYKSNWQQGALKASRRNKWMCQLKQALAKAEIYGPKGNPNAIPAPTRYTEVPWDLVVAGDKKAEKEKKRKEAIAAGEDEPGEGWDLMDKKAVILDRADDVYGEAEELNMSNPRPETAEDDELYGVAASIPPRVVTASRTARTTGSADEVIEMSTRRGPM